MSHVPIATALLQSLEWGLEAFGKPLPEHWAKWIEHYHIAICNLDNPQILLAEKDPLKFCAAAIAFFKIGRGSLFIANAQWQRGEREQVAQCFKPDLVWSDDEKQWSEFFLKSDPTTSPALPMGDEPFICFPTGGSSGQIRFAVHSPQTLAIAVKGFTDFLGPFLPPDGRVNSLCLLPLAHVGGFMQWWRSALTGGKFSPIGYHQIKQQPPAIPKGYVTSLVPTQLQYLLDHHSHWLRSFNLVFLGGAPAWPDLLAQARAGRINLAPTYGMTETAAQIATLTPAEFLAGKTGVGQILPHVRVNIILPDEETSPQEKAGLVTIESDALFKGYITKDGLVSHLQPWRSGDLGYLENGYLHIIGRHNRRIISGGENVDPGEIEAFLLNQNLVQDVVITAVPDRRWGEMVVAIYVPQSDQEDGQALAQYLQFHLAAPKCPKHWLPVADLRRSPLGKLNYQFWQNWAKNRLGIDNEF